MAAEIHLQSSYSVVLGSPTGGAKLAAKRFVIKVNYQIDFLALGIFS